MQQRRIPEINPCVYDQLICNKVPRQFNEERIVFSTDNVEILDICICIQKKKTLDSYLTP